MAKLTILPDASSEFKNAKKRREMAQKFWMREPPIIQQQVMKHLSMLFVGFGFLPND